MKKIIILHGWTYKLDKWKAFSVLLKKAGFEPIFLKIPGLTIESKEIWNLNKYSDWLRDELSKEGKVILLGHSNGGRIAAYFASRFPDKVEKLILVDSAGIYHKELLLQIKRFVFRVLVKVGKIFTSSEVAKNILYYLAGERDYQKASTNMKKTMINLSHHDLTPLLKKIVVDTLIVWGEEDKVTPLSDALLMNKLIKNSKLKVIKGASHAPFFTHSKKVLEIINEFVAGARTNDI